MKLLLKIGLVSALLSGCSSTLYVTKYDPNSTNIQPGVVFYLPKTVLSLEFKYAVYRKRVYGPKPDPKLKSVLKSTEYFIVIEDPITLNNKTVADYDHGFIYDVEESQSTFKDTTIALGMTTSGYLTSVNRTTTDKLSEAIQSTLSFATNIAKIAAVGGADTVETAKIVDIPMSHVIDIDDLLFKCAGKADCAYFVDVSKMSYDTRDCGPVGTLPPQATPTTPSRGTTTSNQRPAIPRPPQAPNAHATPPPVSCALDHTAFPIVSVKFKLEEPASTFQQRMTNQAASLNKVKLQLDGIPYRQSRYIHTTITAEASTDLRSNTYHSDSYQPILQFGSLAYIPYKSDAFENTTQIITFDETTGALTEFQDTSNANASVALEAANQASGKVVESLEALQTYKLVREAAILQAEQAVKTAKDALESSEAEAAEEAATLAQNKKKQLDAENLLAGVEALKDTESLEYQKLQLNNKLALLTLQEQIKSKEAEQTLLQLSEAALINAETATIRAEILKIQAKAELDKLKQSNDDQEGDGASGNP